MPDKTTLVLRDADGEVIDTITTTLPSEIGSLRGRGYATKEELKQLDAARAKQEQPPAGDEPSADGQTTATDNVEEGTAAKAAARGGKKSSTTGR